MLTVQGKVYNRGSWRNEMHSILLCCLEMAIRPCGVAQLIELLLSTQRVLGLIPNTDSTRCGNINL